MKKKRSKCWIWKNTILRSMKSRNWWLINWNWNAWEWMDDGGKMVATWKNCEMYLETSGFMTGKHTKSACKCQYSGDGSKNENNLERRQLGHSYGNLFVVRFYWQHTKKRKKREKKKKSYKRFFLHFRQFFYQTCTKSNLTNFQPNNGSPVSIIWNIRNRRSLPLCHALIQISVKKNTELLV